MENVPSVPGFFGGKIVDRMIPGFEAGKTILAEAKSTLSTAALTDSLAKFTGTLGALGAEAKTVESLLITYTGRLKLADGFAVVGGLLYRYGKPYLVDGFEVFVNSVL
jgi:hypothetical protein